MGFGKVQNQAYINSVEKITHFSIDKQSKICYNIKTEVQSVLRKSLLAEKLRADSL